MEHIDRRKSKNDMHPLITNKEVSHATEDVFTDRESTEEHWASEEVLTEQEVTEEHDKPQFEAPLLSKGELFHVFLSYSSTDSEWTESLMDKLESRGLKVCCHHRDFTAGRTILENMSECITQSQKVLLVLSPDFVSSRWCLLEANMSLFTDCLQRKIIVPVLLRTVSIPLHLAHLTYLEPQHPDFTLQLLRVLCKPNEEQQGSTIVPYQPPSLYNGKSLQPLIAVNDEELNRYSGGLWSTEVPDQLRHIIREPSRYQLAIDCINKVQERAWFRSAWVRSLFVVIAVWLSFLVIVIYFYSASILFYTEHNTIMGGSIVFIILTCILFCFFCKLCTFKKNEARRIVRDLQRAVARANTVLCEENILMGCVTNSKIHLVYVTLDGCKTELSPCLQFEKAVLRFSCQYTCCLAKRRFPFTTPSQATHLEGGICFCQYVFYNLNQEKGCSFRRLLILSKEFVWQ